VLSVEGALVAFGALVVVVDNPVKGEKGPKDGPGNVVVDDVVDVSGDVPVLDLQLLVVVDGLVSSVEDAVDALAVEIASVDSVEVEL